MMDGMLYTNCSGRAFVEFVPTHNDVLQGGPLLAVPLALKLNEMQRLELNITDTVGAEKLTVQHGSFGTGATRYDEPSIF